MFCTCLKMERAFFSVLCHVRFVRTVTFPTLQSVPESAYAIGASGVSALKLTAAFSTEKARS